MILIAGIIVFTLIGILLIILGMLLWKKQRISLIHDYHYRHIKPSDVPAYTRLMGIALLLMGAGCCISGIIMLFAPEYACIAMVFGLFAGLLVMNKAQKTYNGSWFG